MTATKHIGQIMSCECFEEVGIFECFFAIQSVLYCTSSDGFVKGESMPNPISRLELFSAMDFCRV